MRTAIVSGTFDPITVGHLNVIERAAILFDKVVVAVSVNSEKNGFLPDDIRVRAVEASVSHLGNAEVALCDGLLAEFCQKYENPVIVRGVRNGSDFDYEHGLFVINQGLGVAETVMLPAQSGMEHISSTYARELIKFNLNTESIIPESAYHVMEEWLGNNK